jgi:endoglycosylceramidase
MNSHRRGLKANLVALATVAVTATLSVVSSPAAPAAPATSFVSASEHAARAPVQKAGEWVVDGQGRVIISHGFNVVQKPAPFYPDRLGIDDIEFMVRNGFNTARIALIWRAVEPRPGVYDDAYINRIIKVNDLLAKYGIRTLIDFHQDTWNNSNTSGAPEWATLGSPVPLAGKDNWSAFWDDDLAPDGVGIQTHFVNMWRYVAGKLEASEGSRNILGYDPFNEPYPGSNDACVVFTGCPSLEAGALSAFYRRVIAAIRATGDRHVIWPEGTPAQGLAPNSLGNLGDPQVAYNFHQYCLPHLAIGLTPAPDTEATPMSEACAPLDQAQLDTYAKDAHDRNMPAMMSEFGCGDDSGDVANYVDMAGRHLMSWQVWTYYTQDCRGILIDETLPASDANAKQGKLSALNVPYPRAIAGTPLAYDFDRASSKMTFSYSATPAPGRVLSKGAKTEIFIPRRHYPNGYNVVVEGAHVTSESTAAYLTLVAESSVVSVSVTPDTDSDTDLPAIG